MLVLMSEFRELSEGDRVAVEQLMSHELVAMKQACADLKGYCESVALRLDGDRNVRVRFIEEGPDTVKPVESVIRKLSEKQSNADCLFDDVGDLIRCRVVVVNLSDLAQFVDLLENDEVSPLTERTREEHGADQGYQAIHVNGRFGRFGAEIQVRTAAADAWAVLSRADAYRRGPDPTIDRLLDSSADTIRGLDKQFQLVRDLREEQDQQVRDAQMERVASAHDVPEPSSGVEEAEELSASGRPPGLSTRRRPPDQDQVTRAIRELPDAERYVVGQPISEDRVSQLRSGIELHLEDQSIRRIFRAAGAYRREQRYDPDARCGFALNTFKGPFVEGSSWGGYSASAFGNSIQDFLLERFFACLTARIEGDTQVLAGSAQVSSFVDVGANAIRHQGGTPDLVVILNSTRTLGTPLDVWNVLDWDPARLQVRGRDIQGTPFISGSLQHLPVLEFTTDRFPASVHVVDLSDYVYWELNASEQSDELTRLEVEALDPEGAHKAILEDPVLVTDLHRAKHRDRAEYTAAEAVAQVMQRALLEFTAAGDIEESYEPRTQSAKLAEAFEAQE